MADEEQVADEAEAKAKEKAEREALQKRLDGHISENTDGTMIVRLARAVSLGDDDKHHRVTVRRPKVKHIRQAETSDTLSMDHLADLLSSPAGIVAELETDWDRALVIRAVERQLGKYLTDGPPDSP